MKMFLYFVTAVALVLAASTGATAATEVKCTGEIYHVKPPVPNRPTQIRNVIWHNADFLRQACQEQSTSRQSSQPTKGNTQNASSPSRR